MTRYLLNYTFFLFTSRIRDRSLILEVNRKKYNSIKKPNLLGLCYDKLSINFQE